MKWILLGLFCMYMYKVGQSVGNKINRFMYGNMTQDIDIASL